MGERERRALFLPVLAVFWNQLVYCGGRALSRGAPHWRMELEVDRLIPLLPWTVSIYLGCFLFWMICYIVYASQDREEAYRFFCADLLAKGVCLACFLFLPTTMLRPPVGNATLWDWLVRLVYRLDEPTNLFPSIHCLVSWLCFVEARNHRDLPRWVVRTVGILAGLVCLSTLTTRQHLVADVAGGVLLAELSYRAAGRSWLLSPFSRGMDKLLGT